MQMNMKSGSFFFDDCIFSISAKWRTGVINVIATVLLQFLLCTGEDWLSESRQSNGVAPLTWGIREEHSVVGVMETAAVKHPAGQQHVDT